MRQRRGTAERRLFQKAVGDFPDRTAADGGDARNREQIGDERSRRLRVGAGKCREHALIFRLAGRGRERHLFQVLDQQECLAARILAEILHQSPLPGRCQIECGDQSREQCDVAGHDEVMFAAEMRGRLQPERQHLGVGGSLVAAAERFDPGLKEFSRQAAPVTEHRAEIAIAVCAAGRRRGEIVARHGDREIRPQAPFVAGAALRQEHAGPDVLPRQVEERLSRLQDRGPSSRIACALVGADEALRPRIGRALGRRVDHGRGPLARMVCGFDGGHPPPLTGRPGQSVNESFPPPSIVFLADHKK